VCARNDGPASEVFNRHMTSLLARHPATECERPERASSGTDPLAQTGFVAFGRAVVRELRGSVALLVICMGLVVALTR